MFIVCAWSARRHGAGPATTTVIALLGFDLGGGVYVNNTRACARWYEHPGQGTREHLAFAGGGLVLDRVLGPSHAAGWFAGAYYPKLLMGHAAASLWSDEQLHAPPPPTLP